DAKQIHFLTSYGRVELRLNQTPIPLLYVPRTIDAFGGLNDVYGEVAAFAGQTAELSFRSMSTPQNPAVVLDSISFIVPEPPPATLLAFGVCAALWLTRLRSETQGAEQSRKSRRGTNSL